MQRPAGLQGVSKIPSEAVAPTASQAGTNALSFFFDQLSPLVSNEVGDEGGGVAQLAPVHVCVSLVRVKLVVGLVDNNFDGVSVCTSPILVLLSATRTVDTGD